MVHTVYPLAVKIPMKKGRYRVKILYTSHLSPIANFVDPSVANREPVATDRSHWIPRELRPGGCLMDRLSCYNLKYSFPQRSELE
jgi:hypothetical protein